MKFIGEMISKGSSMLLALIILPVALTLIGSVVRGQMAAGMFMGIVSVVFGMIQKPGFQMSRSLENISRAAHLAEPTWMTYSMKRCSKACQKEKQSEIIGRKADERAYAK